MYSPHLFLLGENLTHLSQKKSMYYNMYLGHKNDP